MKLAVGLGNPDKKYAKTRHNLGFMALDNFAKRESLAWRYNPDWICFYIKTRDFVLIKPSTYMNKSGESVVKVRDFFKIKNEDILIVYDDVDLPFEKLRLAYNGLSAGHHGVDSVIESLGQIEFGRLRLGIGRPEKGEVADFVLSEFSERENEKLGDILTRSAEAIASYLSDGIDATMNRFN